MSDLNKLKELRNALSCWQEDYDPTEDKEQYDMFGAAVDAVERLEAAQKRVAELEAEAEKEGDITIDVMASMREWRLRAETAESELTRRDKEAGEPDIIVSKEGAEAIRGIMNREMSGAGRFVTFERYSKHAIVGDRMPLYIAPPASTVPDCEWVYDESDYFWSSACGEDWQFTDGGPLDNRVKFCQGCGGKLKLAEAPAPGGENESD